MLKKNPIFDEIKHTGLAIRDWLGPYYMLGGAVAFCIALFTLLDPSGQLVRFVAVGLFLLTATAWVVFLSRQRTKPAASVDVPAAGAVKPHVILLMVSIFFLAGMLLSEALMRGKHGPEPAPPLEAAPAAAVNGAVVQPVTPNTSPAHNPPETSPPEQPKAAAATGSASAVAAANSNAGAAAAPAALPPVDPAPSVALPSASPVAAVVAIPVVTAPVAKVQEPRGKAELQPKRREPHAKNREPVASTEPATSSADRQRCSSLLSQFSLGEELRTQDKRFLETSCR